MNLTRVITDSVGQVVAIKIMSRVYVKCVPISSLMVRYSYMFVAYFQLRSCFGEKDSYFGIHRVVFTPNRLATCKTSGRGCNTDAL